MWRSPGPNAEAGIPVYLLVDRDTGETLVYSQPEAGAYTLLSRHPFGKTITLPEPVNVELDTEAFKEWVR